MGKEIDFETRELAEELYIIEGLTYEQVAERTDVSVGAVKKWSEADGWRQKRKAYRESLKEIKSNTVQLRKALVKKALGSLDPQDVYAAVRLESIATRQERKPGEVEPDIDKPKLFLENMEFIAKTLKEEDPEGLKVFARNFEIIIERFKTEHTSKQSEH